MFMKRALFIVLAAFMAFAGAAAQDGGERKLTKQERKAMQARVDSILNVRAVKAVTDTMFVLEADQVVFKYGHVAYVTSNTNFVKFDGDRAVVQVAFNVPWSGFNGLGGITVEGNASKYDVTTDKRGNIYIDASVSGRGISAQLMLTLMAGSNKATVTIIPNFNSGRITLEGSIVPLEDSSVFKGSSL